MEGDYLAGLTAAQREAVLHVDGPLLILAGPGSGKTRVITQRVAHLIREGIRPHQILAITFTNKAALEMRGRIQALLPTRGMWISTFHSFGVRVLRHYGERLGLDKNFTIYDQDDRIKLIKASFEAAGVDNARFTPDSIQGAISKAKNQLQSPDKYDAGASDFFGKAAARVYAVYEKKLRDANALDFDDLLMWPALALRNDAEMRAELDERFRYVLVDEYQDTNRAQYGVVRGLSVDFPNLCVVGDPDQSIYKWRGADIRNILDFERDFPSARVITLSENFRSTKAILAAADQLIAHNKQRKPKKLTTSNPEGSPVEVLQFETHLDEAEEVVRRIRRAVEDKKRRYGDFAIFLRLNALSRNLESAFVKHHVPFQIVRGLSFFERKENKDIIAYLRLLLNPRDDLSFLRAVNEPARGVGKTSLEHLRNYAEAREMPLMAAAAEVAKIPAIKGKAASGLSQFVAMITMLRGNLDAQPDHFIRMVLEYSGYAAMLKDSNVAEDVERLANIEELITAAHQFQLEDDSRTIADFLESIALASDVDAWDNEQDCVSVMTLHAAKGLEFPVVYMPACEQGILPHERSHFREEDIEEERRLAFVGMTRAGEELYLTNARLREFRGQTNYTMPSMFLDELPATGVERLDMSALSNPTGYAMERWRGGGPAANTGWRDTGVFRPAPEKGSAEAGPVILTARAQTPYTLGVRVRHENYGVGRVTSVTGTGPTCKIQVKFPSGERTFLADKAKLAIVNV